jgi:hypothetical protein
MKAERMTPTDWEQLNEAYSAQFLPLINPERNVLAAVVDVRRGLNLESLTLFEGDYTLLPTDHGRTIFMDGGNIIIPLGLPAWFQITLRNIYDDDLIIYRGSPDIRLSGINGTSTPELYDFLLLESGWADLTASGPDVFWLSGHVELISPP